MEKITFNIPYPPTKKGKSAFCRRFGLNAYYSGKHWAQRKKDADELHALTLVALKQARVRVTSFYILYSNAFTIRPQASPSP